MWGKAQRVAARPRKPDLGQIKGAEIPPIATSHIPNAIALAYTARAVLNLGGSTCAPIIVWG